MTEDDGKPKKKRVRVYTPEQKQKIADRMRAYRANNKDSMLALAASWNARNPERRKEIQLKCQANKKARLLTAKAEGRAVQTRCRWPEWEKANPERAKAARDRRRQIRADEAKARAALRPSTRPARRAKIKQPEPDQVTIGQRLRSCDLYARVDTLISRWLPPDVREDVVSDLILAILEGNVDENPSPAQARAFVTAHYRRFDRFRVRSLDDFVPGSEKCRFVDLVASDAERL